MAPKIPHDQGPQSIDFYSGGVSTVGAGAHIAGSFGLAPGGASVFPTLSGLVVINIHDVYGNAISITLLPVDAEALAKTIAGVAGAIEER